METQSPILREEAEFWMEDDDTINICSTFLRDILFERNAEDEKGVERNDRTQKVEWCVFGQVATGRHSDVMLDGANIDLGFDKLPMIIYRLHNVGCAVIQHETNTVSWLGPGETNLALTRLKRR
jgi:hypothetical protein